MSTWLVPLAIGFPVGALIAIQRAYKANKDRGIR